MTSFTRFHRLLFCAAALLLSVAFPRTLRAGGSQEVDTPEATVTLDRTRVTVGDPIALTVVVKHPVGVPIETTSIDDQLGPLEPLSSEPPEEKPAAGGMELRLRYKVAAYHTGELQLPQLLFAYTAQDGSRQQIVAKGPPSITVQSVLPAGAEPSDIRGLKSQASLPAPPSAQLTWLAGLGGGAVALAAVLGLALVLLLRRRPPPVVAAPVHSEIARAELDRILALNLPAQGEVAEHYRLIGTCIRRYLSDRFGFSALTLTRSELEGEMEAHGVGRWPARLIAGLLSECDAVAYARYLPAPTRLAADNAMAYEIIDLTEGPVTHAAARAV